MKKLIIIIFIINIFIGQLLYSQIKPRETEISKDLVINLYEKLRMQTIILTFFYSKIDRVDDFENIFELKKHHNKFKCAKKVYEKTYCVDRGSCESRAFDVFKKNYSFNVGKNINRDYKGRLILDSVFYQKIMKDKYCDLEPFCFLASILNEVNLELIKMNEQFFIDSTLKRFVSLAYNLFIIAMHQFPICICESENFFYQEFLDCLRLQKIENLDKDYLIEIILFLSNNLDMILKKSLNLVLLLPESQDKIKLIMQVFTSNDIFPYIFAADFCESFDRLCYIRVPEDKYFEFAPEDFSEDSDFEFSIKEFEELLLSEEEPFCNEIEYEDLFKELMILYNI